MSTIRLYWLQAGGCGGDTWSLLSAESPDILELLDLLEIELLWHPSLSTRGPADHQRLTQRLLAGEEPLDVLCVEGAAVRGPGGTGMYDTWRGQPKKDLIAGLARRAGAVVAVGTCASFGGVGGEAEVEAVGLQYRKETRGGLLGVDFRSARGLPVINLPGCPAHPAAVTGALSALARGLALTLDEHQAPLDWYGTTVHQGCTRNEYHEYRVEEKEFGEKGCLFFHMGCRGPLVHATCNKVLWNRRSTKTRVGVPCFGCTEPDFPQPHPFFKTRNIEGLPLDLPNGISRPHYLALKSMAAAAAPERLTSRKTGV